MQASAQEQDEVELKLPSHPTSIKRARDAVARLAEQVGAPVSDVKLAVSEAVTNALIHGYRGDREGDVRVAARVDRGRLLVVVADDGVGMKPNLESPGLGVGVSLITALAHDVRFDSTANGLTVSMSFEAARA